MQTRTFLFADLRAQCGRAVELADQIGHPDLSVRARNFLAIGLVQTGATDAALTLMHEAIAMAAKHELLYEENSARHNLVYLGAAARVGPEEHARAQDDYLLFAKRFAPNADHGGLAIAIDRATAKGDWDAALQLVEAGDPSTVWAAGRRIRQAFIRAARHGPSPELDMLATHSDLLRGTGGSQWVRGAAMAAGVRFTIDDLSGALADARTIVDHEDEIAPVQQLAIGLLAADRLDDQAAVEAFSQSVRRHAAVGGSVDAEIRIAETLASAIAADRGGDRGRALSDYGRCADLAERWTDWLIATEVRLRRARLLAAAGDLVAARAELDRFLPYWRKAKATWYLGEIEKKARAMGIEPVPA